MSEDDENHLIGERRAKLAKLRERGIAFPNDFRRNALAGDLTNAYGGKSAEALDANPVRVIVAGRMRAKRVMGKASFAKLEDSTGAISYVNLRVWNSIDLNVPNQLWYDVKGRLLGVDYTILESQSANAPATLFGYAIDPSRWIHRNAHMHWGFTAADGLRGVAGDAERSSDQ